MTFSPCDPTPVYAPDTHAVYVEDRRYAVGNITAATARKPITHRDIDRLMRSTPTRR